MRKPIMFGIGKIPKLKLETKFKLKDKSKMLEIVCEEFLQAALQEPTTVYFNQHLGAAHSKTGQNMSF